MGIRYAGDSYNRAAGTRAAFAALSADLEREGLPAIFVNDGDREVQDEIDVFLARYRPQATGVGPFNDVRTWNGVRYVRYSPLGTVAVPGTGNHGKRRANDLGFPYGSDTAPHRRAQVLAKRHNITCEGMGFREWWHWTFWGPLGAIGAPAGGATASATPAVPKPEFEEDAMKDFLLLKVLVPGGFRRYIIDPRSEGKREISQIKYDLYKNGGMATVPGDQPPNYAEEFPNKIPLS